MVVLIEARDTVLKKLSIMVSLPYDLSWSR